MTSPIPLAEAFQYCPRCGDRQANPGANPFRCSSCEFVFHFGPVGAVGAIITDDQNQVLLIRRAKDPGKGQYGLPGGFVDPGESAEVAMRREVDEELGLTVTGHELLISFPNSYNYRGVVLPVLDVFYICTVDPSDSIQAAASEVSSWEWCECNDRVLAQMAFDSNRKALQVFLETRV